MGTDIACRVESWGKYISVVTLLPISFIREIHFHPGWAGWLAGKCLLNLNLIFAPKGVWEWMRQREQIEWKSKIIAVLFRSRFFLIYFIFAYFIWFLNKLSQFYCLLFTAFHYTMSSIFILFHFNFIELTRLSSNTLYCISFSTSSFLQRDVKILEPTGSDILSCVSKGKREVSFSRIIEY